MEPQKLDDLFSELIERLEDDARFDVENFLREHADHAIALRERFEKLRRAGLVAERTGDASFGRATTAPSLAEAHAVEHLPSSPSEASPFGPDGSREVLEVEGAIPQSELFGDLLGSLSLKPPSFGRYRVKGELGRGGMGCVLQVWDAELKRHVAMKVMRGSGRGKMPGASDASIIGRFLDEAQITAQLEHPAIVPVHELGLGQDGQLYFTMRLVKGRHLGEILEHVRTGAEGWNTTRALNVLLRACEALAFAHSKGVVHRDLKPSNIMVGRFGEVYVMDWGLAKVVGTAERGLFETDTEGSGEIQSERSAAAAPDSPLQTRGGSVLGTLAYMPPEQARGDLTAIGPHSDVYSMGAVLYHLLTGETPYGGRGRPLEPHQVLAKLLIGPPKPVYESVRIHPPELVAICEKAMARLPEQRYASVRELADDLQAFLEVRVVRAHRTGAWAEARKWVGRNRGLAAGLGAAALVFAVATPVSVSFGVREARAANIAKRREADLRSTIGFTEELFRRLEEHGHGPELADALIETIRSASADFAAARDQNELQLALTREVGTSLSQNPYLYATVLQLMANVLRHQARYEDAWRLQEKALELRRSLEPTGRASIASTTNAANLLMDLTRFREAEQTLRQGIEVSRVGLGPDDVETLVLQCNLGLLLAETGRFEEARRILEQTLEAQARVLGGENPATLVTLANLGKAYQGLGRGEEAEAIFQRYLEVTRSTSRESITTYDAENRLGVHLLNLGKPAEAEPLLRHAVDGRIRIYGEPHPRTIEALQNLASSAKALGRTAEATDLFKRCLTLGEEVLAPDDPVLLGLRGNIAALMKDAERFEEAEVQYLLVLDGWRRTTGDDSLNACVALRKLGSLYRAWGRGDDAERCFRQAFEGVQRVVGMDSPETLACANNLCASLLDRGELAEVETILEQARAVLARHEGAASYADVRARLAEKSGRLSRARDLLQNESPGNQGDGGESPTDDR